MSSNKHKKIWQNLDEQQKQIYLKHLQYTRYTKNPNQWVQQQTNKKLTTYQKKIVHAAAATTQPVNELAIRAPRGAGKLLDNQTPILTPHGFKPIGEIMVGETVYDEQGQPCQVVQTNKETPEKAYEITFSTGETITACDQHQWVTLNTTQRKKWKQTQKNWVPQGTQQTTQQILETLTTGKRKDSNHCIPVTQPVQIETKKVLPVDPYILGFWIGDGNTGSPYITCNNNVYDYIKNRLGKHYLSSIYNSPNSTKIRFNTTLWNELKKLNQPNNKHVPDQYLYTNTANRKLLFHGLMDSDGHMDKHNRVEFSQSDERIAKQMVYLAASLGQKPSITSRIGKIYGKPKKINYRVTWRATIQPFLAPARKKPIEQVSQTKKHYHRMIKKIEPVPTRPMACLTVDSPNNMYLAGETLIPTHNTFLTATIISWFIDVWETLGIDWAVLTTAPTMDTLKNSLWKEIHRSTRSLKNPNEAAKEANKLRMEGNHGIAVSKTVPPGAVVNIEGMHARRMLVVIDEAKGVRDQVYESIQGSYSEAGAEGTDNRAIVVLISTPGEKKGKFYQIFTQPDKYPTWNTFHITQKEAVTQGRLSKFEINKVLKSHGAESALYQNHYLGEFATDESESWLPPAWIKKSNERWKQLQQTGQLEDGGSMIVGLDVARHGSDATCYAVYNPRKHAITKIFTEEYTENLLDLVPKALELGKHIVLDAVGMGASLYDAFRKYLEEFNVDASIHGFSGGESTDWETQTGFPVVNKRSAAYIRLRECLQPTEDTILALPLSLDLENEIYAQRYSGSFTGRVGLEKKDQVKKRLGGKSPDAADAVVMALWSRLPESGGSDLPNIAEIKSRYRW